MKTTDILRSFFGNIRIFDSNKFLFPTRVRQTGNSAGDESQTKDKNFKIEDLSEPTNCCMSGCANCVWIEYAEKLSELMKDSDQSVQKIIMEKVQDPNMRSFLSMELRLRNLK